MVLSYVRSLWRFMVASLVASSVAVAVRYGNVCGSFSGNEELVASLMAKMGAAVFWWQRGWQLCMAKIELEV